MKRTPDDIARTTTASTTDSRLRSIAADPPGRLPVAEPEDVRLGPVFPHRLGDPMSDEELALVEEPVKSTRADPTPRSPGEALQTLHASLNATHARSPQRNDAKEVPMSNPVENALKELSTIDGFIAGAVGNSASGMVMGSIGGSDKFNVEVAVAANTEVVKSKNRAMKALKIGGGIEDILITLTDQYHLIRPLQSHPEIFLYLAVDRERANLGMARFTLANAEGSLNL